jgi:hypothetical protein
MTDRIPFVQDNDLENYKKVMGFYPVRATVPVEEDGYVQSFEDGVEVVPYLGLEAYFGLPILSDDEPEEVTRLALREGRSVLVTSQVPVVSMDTARQIVLKSDVSYCYSEGSIYGFYKRKKVWEKMPSIEIATREFEQVCIQSPVFVIAAENLPNYGPNYLGGPGLYVIEGLQSFQPDGGIPCGSDIVPIYRRFADVAGYLPAEVKQIQETFYEDSVREDGYIGGSRNIGVPAGDAFLEHVEKVLDIRMGPFASEKVRQWKARGMTLTVDFYCGCKSSLCPGFRNYDAHRMYLGHLLGEDLVQMYREKKPVGMSKCFVYQPQLELMIVSNSDPALRNKAQWLNAEGGEILYHYRNLGKWLPMLKASLPVVPILCKEWEELLCAQGKSCLLPGAYRWEGVLFHCAMTTEGMTIRKTQPHGMWADYVEALEQQRIDPTFTELSFACGDTVHSRIRQIVAQRKKQWHNKTYLGEEFKMIVINKKYFMLSYARMFNYEAMRKFVEYQSAVGTVLMTPMHHVYGDETLFRPWKGSYAISILGVDVKMRLIEGKVVYCVPCPSMGYNPRYGIVELNGELLFPADDRQLQPVPIETSVEVKRIFDNRC